MTIPVLAISAVLELIQYVVNREGLKGRTPEEILTMWAQNRIEVRAAIDAWRAAQAPAPEPKPAPAPDVTPKTE